MMALPRTFAQGVLTGILLSGGSLPLQNSHAQVDTAARPEPTLGMIDTVIVTGNEKTREYVILDEMTLKPGSSVTPAALEFDRNRIYSLGLFTRVDLLYDSLDGVRFLNVDVGERWYIIPTLLAGFRDGDPKKPFFGGGLLHNNVAGRNKKLFAGAVFGYDPSLSFSYSDPQIDRTHNLYISGGLSYSKVRNRSELAKMLAGDFDERHYTASVTLGQRFNLYATGGITIGYNVVTIDEYQPGRTVSPSGRDRYLTGTLGYMYDSRDLREYASLGAYVSASVSKWGFGESELSFTQLGADVRHYTPLPVNLVLATRLQGTYVLGGLVPTHARTYFGYGERIRGYFNTVFEGENITSGTVELRLPVLSPRTIIFTLLPLPAEFSVWRFGISVAAFADAGATWFGNKVQWNSFVAGYGAGIVFLLPYGYVLRTEYAFSDHGKGQFILDVRGSI